MIKITSRGDLYLMRGKDYREQLCPIATFPKEIASCDDWCPRFKEPERFGGDIFIKLCSNTIHQCKEEDFIDGRK